MAALPIGSTKAANEEHLDLQVDCHKAAFVCPYCGKCTFEQFFSEGCPKQPVKIEKKKVLFPYLDSSGLDEDDRTDFEEQLKSETREIKLCFAKFTLNVVRSLENLQIPLKKIKMSILSLGAFTDDIGVKVLDEEDKQEIKAAESLTDVFITLQNYISFFNYHIIEHIIDQHGAVRDHKWLAEYLEKFHKFCERSIFEVPHNVFASKSRKKAKVFAIKCTKGVTTMQGVEKLKGKVAEIFGLRHSALQLCSVKKGCVELHFLVCAAIAARIFPMSSCQHLALSYISVRVLSCDGVNQIDIEETIENLQVKNYDVSSNPAYDSRPSEQDMFKGFLAEELISACRKGLRSKASSLVAKGADVNYFKEERWTALHAACQYGYEKVVELLIQEKANVNIQTVTGCTALWIASSGGFIRCVQILIEAKARVDTQDKWGWTALYVASHNGHDGVVKILLKAGPEYKNIRTKDGWTALFAACMEGHDKVVKILLKAGADFNIKTNDGWTALSAAAQKGHNHVVSNLLEAGADVNIQTCNALYGACQEGHGDTTKILLRAGANLNIRTLRDRWTALAVACNDGHDEIVKILVLAGADLNLQADNGSTALWLASHNGHIRCVEALIIGGADLDTQNEKGWTALYVACQQGHNEIVKILLLAGADYCIQANDGHTAMWTALYNGCATCVGLLVNAGDVRNEGSISDYLQFKNQQLKDFILQSACECLTFEEVWKLANGTQCQSLPKDEGDVLNLKLDVLDNFYESNPTDALAEIMETIKTREQQEFLANRVEEYYNCYHLTKKQNLRASNHILTRQRLTASLKTAEHIAGLLMKQLEEVQATAKEIGYKNIEENLAHKFEIIKRQKVSLASNVRYLQTSHSDCSLEDSISDSEQYPVLSAKHSPKISSVTAKKTELLPSDIPDTVKSEHVDFTGGTGDSGLGTEESDRTAWIIKLPVSSSKTIIPDSIETENVDSTGGTGDSGLGMGESDRTAWIYKFPTSSQSSNFK